MESNYSNRDFEQYVKKNADEYRMFPSEKVWKGVNSALHTKRRWPGLGLALLLLVTGGAVTWVMTSYPVSSKASLNAPLAIKEETTPAASAKEIDKILAFNQPQANNHIDDKRAPILSVDRPLAFSGETIPPVNAATVPAANINVNSSDALSTRPEISRNTIVNNISMRPAGVLPAMDMPVNSAIIAELNTKASQPPVKEVKEDLSNLLKAPLTIESVTNAYVHEHKKNTKKISWQVFLTPTVSYRRLSINKAYTNSASNSYPFVSLTDVNKVVTHKPDLGFQVGVTAGYPLTKALKVRVGVQANVNRYDIKAFAYNTEMVTINLNSGAGSSSVSAATNYRNYGGYKTDWIKNYYLSVSIPVGAEVTLFGNKKTSVGFAGTVQPTYIISDRAYLISTDYKNYAKVPWLIRHVNISTGFETFVNYSSGNTRWQVGPQVRYQMLSSFQNKYPVKENLFDFGLKVGVFLNQ